MKPIIEVNHVWKEYQKGIDRRYKSLRDTLARIPNKVFGAEKEKFWALEDIDFKVEAGESVGIIGKNGAGKSTLLKILSRITPPTKGEIILRGRVASLLEVGTGFHPELTGRENVFFNGSILGMKHAEIKSKFDEIVAFSGVESFIDTPLKHYSSGMQMRLAFSVAAHLDSEILLIDEVLAVGDAEFQKKCIGKMDEVSKGEGKTILFVSHQITQIEKLCNLGILVETGNIKEIGQISTVCNSYVLNNSSTLRSFNRNSTSNSEIIAHAELNKDTIDIGENMQVRLTLSKNLNHYKSVININIFNIYGELLCHLINHDQKLEEHNFIEGNSIEIKIKNINLVPGHYFISIWIGKNMYDCIDKVDNVLSFNVVNNLNFISKDRIIRKDSKFIVQTEWIYGI